MKHKKKKITLGRRSFHREQLLLNLCSSLLKDGYIVTTEAKAKLIKGHMDNLLLHGRRELTLRNRRYLLSRLNQKNDLGLLLEAAKEAGNRSSGFSRLTRMPRRAGDGAAMMRVDLIKS